MQQILRRHLLLLLLFTAALRPLASNYLYLIDTSASMRNHRASVIEAITRDIQRGLDNDMPLYQNGDRIHLWSFDSAVEKLRQFQIDTNNPANLSVPIMSELNKLKMDGTTSIAEPLRRSLEEFRNLNSGSLFVFLYTDGKARVSKKELESISKLYQDGYKGSGKSSRLFVIHFGKGDFPDRTRELINKLEGRIVVAGEVPDISPGSIIRASPVVPVPAPPPASASVPVVSVEPAQVKLFAEAASELTVTVPLELKLSEARDGLLLGVSLESRNFPKDVSIAAVSDRIAVSAKQSVALILKNATPGDYAAILKLSSPDVKVEPSEIPVAIQILQPKAEEIGAQFHPVNPSLIQIPGNGQWHPIPNLSLALFYPEHLSNALVRFETSLPDGMEIQGVTGGETARTFALTEIFKLGELNKTVSFRARSGSTNLEMAKVQGSVALRAADGQKLAVQGNPQISFPVEILPPLQVRVDTKEISLGEFSRSTQSVRKALSLKVAGKPNGQKIKIDLQGNGLSGILVTPAELLLQEGLNSFDVEFSGFTNRSIGFFDGTLLISPAPGHEFAMIDSAVKVRGQIAAPKSLLAEAESSMVVGQRITVRAHFESREKGRLSATIRPPDSTRDYEIALADNGLSDDGDSKPGDGIYSGIFTHTDALGKYQITVSGVGEVTGAQQKAIAGPIYFRSPAEPLTGSIPGHRKGEFIKLATRIVSEYPEEIPVLLEHTNSAMPFKVYLSDKSTVLKRGENDLELLAELLPTGSPGDYKSQIHFVTASIDGTKARIPTTLEIRVTSYYEYFIRMIAGTLIFAGGVFLAIVRPWRKPKPQPDLVSFTGKFPWEKDDHGQSEDDSKERLD